VNNTIQSDQLQLAAAYLSRVSEPGVFAVWDCMAEHGEAIGQNRTATPDDCGEIARPHAAGLDQPKRTAGVGAACPPGGCRSLCPRPITRPLNRCAQGATCRSLPNNDHARTFENGAIVADHSEEQVEIQKGASSFERHGASTASRCAQRCDRTEVSACADAIGRGLGCPGNGEGGVWGGIVDVDLDLGNEVGDTDAGRGDDDLADTLPRNGSQFTLRARRIGLRRRGCGHSRAGREHGNDDTTEPTCSDHDMPLSLDLHVLVREREVADRTPCNPRTR
jgi:hypothetical protein